jgi:hypothetical protein
VDTGERETDMTDIKSILDILSKAVEDGRTVTIKADEVKVDAGEMTASGLEITVE